MKNIGAFEEHEGNVMLDLWNEITKYYAKHNTKVGLDRIFNSVCDYLFENEDSWLWGVVWGDIPSEESLYSNITHISKKLEEYQYVLYKPVHNNYGEIVGYDKKPLIKDKHFYPKWDETKTYRTPKGILVRYSNKNYISLKGISTNGIIMSVKDFNLFCNETKLDLDTLTPPQLEKLIIDYKITNEEEYWKKYSTIRVFNESLLVEKGIVDGDVLESESRYVVGKGFSQERSYDFDLDLSPIIILED